MTKSYIQKRNTKQKRNNNKTKKEYFIPNQPNKVNIPPINKWIGLAVLDHVPGWICKLAYILQIAICCMQITIAIFINV